MKGPQLSIFNYSIKNKADSTVDIFIDGDIVDAPAQAFLKEYFTDDTSTSYKSFRDIVNSTDAAIYNVYINSGGGQVTEAMAIHDLLLELQDKGKTVNTVGRGIIASSATYILMAGKSPEMSSNSWLMIHNVSGFCYGDVNEVENYAATMRKFNNAATSFYQNFTGLSKTVVANMMNSETWMTADEAKTNGFVKSISGEVAFKNSIKPEQWQFNNSAVLNSYNSFIKNSSMDTNKITEAITNGFNTILEKLGLKDKANDESVKNAFNDFSTSITNSLKEIVVPDQEVINKMVGEAVTNALKTIPVNFTEAITNATKDHVTKEDLNAATSNVLNKADFTKEMDALKASIINKIGNKTSGEEEGEAKNKSTGKRRIANRFSGYTEDYFSAGAKN